MDFQQRLAEVIEYMTAFNVVKVDVEISGIAEAFGAKADCAKPFPDAGLCDNGSSCGKISKTT